MPTLYLRGTRSTAQFCVDGSRRQFSLRTSKRRVAQRLFEGLRITEVSSDTGYHYVRETASDRSHLMIRSRPSLRL